MAPSLICQRESTPWALRALEDQRAPTTLSALAVEVAEEVQGQGVSRLVIQALAEVARSAGLGPLVAPVRPSWKDRYPLIPIKQYASGGDSTECHSIHGCESMLGWEQAS
jgi:GNAT superfamily N-acetyltransferase